MCTTGSILFRRDTEFRAQPYLGGAGRAEGTLEAHTMLCPLFSFEVQKQGPGLMGAAARSGQVKACKGREWPGVAPQATGQGLVRGLEF